MAEHIHTTHPEIIKRLKRADGHLRSVIGAIPHEQRQPVDEFKTITKYF